VHKVSGSSSWHESASDESNVLIGQGRLFRAGVSK
jgi:hypothetical protein